MSHQTELEEKVSMVHTMRFDLVSIGSLVKDCRYILTRAREMTTDPAKRDGMDAIVFSLDPITHAADAAYSAFCDVFGPLPPERKVTSSRCLEEEHHAPDPA